MQKICHVERFICTETPVEADGIQTFFLFEMSRTTKRQAKQQLGGNPFSPKYSTPTNGRRYSILFTVVWVDVSGGRR
jgi:hypothetical protein